MLFISSSFFFRSKNSNIKHNTNEQKRTKKNEYTCRSTSQAVVEHIVGGIEARNTQKKNSIDRQTHRAANMNK